jgi:membrane associated rhomboid family serine protease
LISRFSSSLPFLIGFVAVIWVVEIVNASMGHQLNAWGIFPRSVHGLAGIPLAPFLHGGFGHVISNSIPFLVLGGLIAFRGRQVLLRVSFIVIGVGGSGVWLLARSAVHIGASGLVFGYFGYLVARGWYERRLGSILLAIAVIILYGGLILGVLPARGLVSWEAHLFGLIAGILAARSHRR